jgi:hypothetical protein
MKSECMLLTLDMYSNRFFFILTYTSQKANWNSVERKMAFLTQMVSGRLDTHWVRGVTAAPRKRGEFSYISSVLCTHRSAGLREIRGAIFEKKSSDLAVWFVRPAERKELRWDVSSSTARMWLTYHVL